MTKRFFLVALLLGAQAVRAQSTGIADSLARLNRSGRYLEAASLGRRSIAQAPSVEAGCAVRVEMLTAMDSVGMYLMMQPEVAAADSVCSRSDAFRARAADVLALRRDAYFPLPETGIDFSAVDHFNALAAKLSAGTEPSAAEWKAFYRTPGYQFAAANEPGMRSMMELAFLPAMAAQRDSLMTRRGDEAFTVRYLRAGFDARASLQRWRDTMPLAAIAQRAKARTMRYMPAGFSQSTPFVAFAVFTPDGFSMGPQGVILDLPYASKSDVEAFLAHEFHHSLGPYVSTINREMSPTSPDVTLFNALVSLRNEGLADLIDKPYPLVDQDSTYQRLYRAAYDRTPQILHAVDSLLTEVANDSTNLRAVGRAVQNALWSGSHPNGAYMAREIQQTFGDDSLMPALKNPFAMFRTYAAAERVKGNPPPFSAKSIAALDAMERTRLGRR